MESVIRTEDGELCGHVQVRDGSWYALVVFGAVLGRHSTREDAVAQVLSDGLASLAERWTLVRDDDGSSQHVCIQEANARSVTVALDYYSMPGVPTLTIAAAEIAAGTWSLHRQTTARRTGEVDGACPSKDPSTAAESRGVGDVATRETRPAIKYIERRTTHQPQHEPRPRRRVLWDESAHS
jgi:hypothetical protein